jgi:hypothetical protein
MTGSTLLYRQVHPSWVQLGRVTSQVFRPTPKDQKKLSAYDGDQITASDAWRHFTSVLGFASVGVLAVSTDECRALGLAATPDPAPFPEHVLIDFTPYTENEIKSKAKQLRAHADLRGWQFRAPDDAGSGEQL